MIRPATEKDLDAMVLLLKQLFGIEADFAFDAQMQKKGLELLLDSKTSIILVAERQDSVVGMGTGQLVISTAEGGPSLLIEDIVVQPAWQQQGIGSALLQALGNWGASRGAIRMQLLADRTNSPALVFYQAAGWQTTQLICLRKYHPGQEENPYEHCTD